MFAVVGGSQFSIYECMPSGPIKLQMCFEAPDVNDVSNSSLILSSSTNVNLLC